jgi:hypothetical protein
MTIKFAQALVDDMLSYIETAFTAGGTCEYRTGAAPSSTTDPDSGTLLATFTLGAPAFGAPGSGSIALTGSGLSTMAVATGTLGHARFKDSLGVVQFDVPASLATPVVDTDDVSDELETLGAHPFVANQAVYLYEGTTASGPLYVILVDATHIQLAASPGGAALPMPAPGTYTAAYLRDARFSLSLNNATGNIDTGGNVFLTPFGIAL